MQMMKKPRARMALISLSTALVSVAATATHGSSGHARRVTVMERGLYSAASEEPCEHSDPSGHVMDVTNARLQRSTTRIPAERHVRFGLRFFVEGEPQRDSAPIRMITRFPKGGLFDTQSSQKRFVSAYSVTAKFGKVLYRDYTLSDDWKVVPGLWVFEFWQGDTKLAQQEFCLYAPGHADDPDCPELNS